MAVYTDADAERKYLPQYFKFMASNPLSVRTKVLVSCSLPAVYFFRLVLGRENYTIFIFVVLLIFCCWYADTS